MDTIEKTITQCNALPRELASLIAAFSGCYKPRDGAFVRQIANDDPRREMLDKSPKVEKLTEPNSNNCVSWVENFEHYNFSICLELLDYPGHWRTYREIYKQIEYRIKGKITNICIKLDGTIVINPDNIWDM